jgi:hypothetical protein
VEGADPQVCLSADEITALDKMDDPSMMDHYVKVGTHNPPSVYVKVTHVQQQGMPNWLPCCLESMDGTP